MTGKVDYCSTVQETDGSPISAACGQINVPNGSASLSSGTLTLNYAGAPSGGVFTAGSVPFGDGTASLAQNNANVFWDNTNNRLGIGTTGPSSLLHTTGTFTAASGTEIVNRFAPTINQSGTAAYTALLVNATETATGSGTKNLLDLQKGGTSKFRVTSSSVAFMGDGTDNAYVDFAGAAYQNMKFGVIAASNRSALNMSGNGYTIYDNSATLGGGNAIWQFGTARGELIHQPQPYSAGAGGIFNYRYQYAGPADTGMTASTENNGFYINASAIRQWLVGALTTQREVRIDAPTYAFTGASTITTAATLAISGAPVAGTNATITNAYGLWVQGGTSRFDGATAIFGPGESGTPTAFTLRGANASGTNIAGANVTFDASNGTGTGGSGALVFRTAPAGATGSVANTLTEAMRIDSSQRVLINGAASYGRLNQLLEVNSSSNQGGLSISNWTSSANSAVLDINKSKSGTVGTQTAVTANDNIGAIVFRGSSGSAFLDAAVIQGDVDSGGTISATSMPGRLRFITTADGASSGTERMRIDRSGNVGIGTTSPVAGGGLTIAPSASTSGSPALETITGPAHTTLTASTEATDVNLNLARTVQFATGALTTQRAVRIQAPTYGFVAASTITNAATLHIDAAPTAGTNATITNAYALWLDAGNARFDGVLLAELGSASAAAYSFQSAGTADADTGMFSSGADTVNFSVAGSEAARFANLTGGGVTTPRLLIGQTTLYGDLSRKFAIASSGGAGTNGGMDYSSWNTSSGNGPVLEWQRSKSSTVGTHTAVVSGDFLGGMQWVGSDGTAFATAANLFGVVDGAVSANKVPGRLVFQTTAVGASAVTERMRITSAGLVGINTASPNTTLHVNGGFSVGLVSKTAAYTATTSDSVILCSDAAGSFTVTLPAATNTGMIVRVVKTNASANTVTVAAAGTDTIEGGASIGIGVQYQKVQLVADGVATWYDLGTGNL